MNSWAAAQITILLICRLGEEVTETHERLASVEKAVDTLRKARR